MNRHLRISFIAEFLPDVGAPKVDVNISVGKLHFGLTKHLLTGKIVPK